jgi:protein-S-isoprenylcysteine O-methyltransferase Ste14
MRPEPQRRENIHAWVHLVVQYSLSFRDVIDTGPCGIVRQRIHSGILLAAYATAATKGTILGPLGALLITAGLWMRARPEEGWLRGELDPGVHDDYRRKVPMLVPFGLR